MSSQYQGFVAEPVTNKIINAEQVDEETQVVQLRGFDNAISQERRVSISSKCHHASKRSFACLIMSMSNLTQYFTRMPTASYILRPIRVTRARWCSVIVAALVTRTPQSTFGSTRHRFHSRPEEMDYVFDSPYARLPHPSYGDARIPAYDMIKFSVNIMRGCFGGCTFCSITEHEGRIIQNRSEESILREVEAIRDTAPNYTGVYI